MRADDGQGWLQRAWYGRARGAFLLWPLEWLFRAVAALRRTAFRSGLARTGWVDAPVIVVGNIVAGGSGKTPLAGWLAKRAQAGGLRPAIVSRGYGGSEPEAPIAVTPTSAASVVGDEPLMLARETGLPVYVSRDRLAAASHAVAQGADLVIADDGLQHYGLGRDVEIAVVDAARGHGNGHCLPAGPLREPVSRLDRVDLVVHANGGEAPTYTLAVEAAVNAESGERRPLAAFAGAPAHVVAGIGHPERFHDALSRFGIDVRPVAVPDHGKLVPDALSPDDALPVLMTSKDAVKYAGLGARHWVVPATVTLTDADADAIAGMLALAQRRHRARGGRADV